MSPHQCGYCKSLVQYHFREIVNLSNALCDDYLSGTLCGTYDATTKSKVSNYAVIFFTSEDWRIVTATSIKRLVIAVAEFKEVSTKLFIKLLESLDEDDIDCIHLYNQFASSPSDSIRSVWKVDSRVFDYDAEDCK